MKSGDRVGAGIHRHRPIPMQLRIGNGYTNR
jgi:hypothetical protein